MLRWLLEWFHMFIISMHDWAAVLPGCPAWAVACNWTLCWLRKLASKTKKKRSLQCSDMIYMKRETIALQDWSKHRKVQEVSAEVVAQRWEVQGENCAGTLILFLLCQRSSLVQVMTQHPAKTSASWWLPWQLADLLPLILPKPPSIKGMSNL